MVFTQWELTGSRPEVEAEAQKDIPRGYTFLETKTGYF